MYDAYTRNAVRFVSFVSSVWSGSTLHSLYFAALHYASLHAGRRLSSLHSLSVGLSGLMAVKGGVGRWGLDGIVSLVLTLLLYGLCSSERLIILQSW